MDYEKAYKEALKRAKSIYRDAKEAGCSHTDWLEHIFPELAESEDERIRNEILIYIGAKQDIDLETHNRWCTYLEKQKEQKPVEYLDKDKVYAIMTKLTNFSFSKLIPILSDEYKKIDEITSDVRSLLDYPIEQKPAEWKPTEEQFNYLAKAIMTLGEEGDCKTAGILSEIRKGLKCSFPDWKVSPDYPEEGCNVSLNGEVKKIQEWSEEDELMILTVIQTLETLGGSGTTGMQIDWLKSLRPLPHWKPSEEQMKALEKAIIRVHSDDEIPILTELRQQLKKL